MPRIALLVFGIYSVAVGVFMLAAPGVFFDTLGAFGARNDHYIFDNASFELPLGLLMLAAGLVFATGVLAIALRISVSDEKVGVR
ncbi:hypothetical protein [Mycolicibacterium sp. P9-22]|uniref:hypothetical protein n=1 Tax=Mycolicibacterium sp. P9-22 TaxID=2024613 RepID=UPI0011EBD54F|nr:hypothetical protein [Mycolicibacterium sp. P9-22]KAA0112488.1 hypothetical protein CIW51_26950 [Mycolicibacterium sp. P9-22]